MEDLKVVNCLDEDLFYVVDFVIGLSGDVAPGIWTADRVGNGYYKAQYQGATVNSETGEATGGTWVETGGPSHEDYVSSAEYTRRVALEEAGVKISDLQDLSDVGEATDDQLQMLLSWKKYRVALNKLDTSTAPDITWPEQPA